MEGMVFCSNKAAMKVYGKFAKDMSSCHGIQLMEAEGEPFERLVKHDSFDGQQLEQIN